MVCALLALAAAQDTLGTIGDATYLAELTEDGYVRYLKYPVLGCGAIVPAGGTGRAIVKLPSAAALPAFKLSISSVCLGNPVTYDLEVASITEDAARHVYEVTYRIPAGVIPTTYNLHLAEPALGIQDKQPNALRVVREVPSSFTFVVLADTQLGDPRGWYGEFAHSRRTWNPETIMEQLRAELRALDPLFVIICGDLLFGWDYDAEYAGGWETWSDLGIPIFMVPGNHDAQACVEPRTLLGILSPLRDGLSLWRKTFGPLCFSFDVGGVHFVGVNSADGSPEKRDGFRMVVENFGGDLSQEQMNWLRSDMQGRTGCVTFLHHAPLGPYRDSVDFGMGLWVANRLSEFLNDGSLQDFDQVWNTKATADFLIDLQRGRTQACFVGHEHKDKLEVSDGVPYVWVTSASSAGASPWGYRPLRVEGGRLGELEYALEANAPSLPAGNLDVEELSPGRWRVTSGLPRPTTVRLYSALPPGTKPSNRSRDAASEEYAATDGTTHVWETVEVAAAPSVDEPVELEHSVVDAPAAASSARYARPTPKKCAGGGAPSPLAAILLLVALAAALRYIRG